MLERGTPLGELIVGIVLLSAGRASSDSRNIFTGALVGVELELVAPALQTRGAWSLAPSSPPLLDLSSARGELVCRGFVDIVEARLIDQEDMLDSAVRINLLGST